MQSVRVAGQCAVHARGRRGQAQTAAAGAEREPQPGDYDDVIGDLEPEACGPAFGAGRAVPPGLQAIVGTAPSSASPARPTAVVLSVLLDVDIVRRLRDLAAVSGTHCQTLIEQFVAERLEEEEVRRGLGG